MEKQLVFNSIICLNCGEQLITRHNHDFKKCSCENETFIDGGLEPFGRFGGKNLEMIQPFTIFDDEKHEVIRFYLERGTYGKNGDESLKHVKLKDIDDEWLKAIIKYEEEKRPNNRFIKHYKNELKYRNKK